MEATNRQQNSRIHRKGQTSKVETYILDAENAARNIALKKPADADLYVLQDGRSHADNQLLFWSKNAEGYTTDLNKAHRFTHEQALAQQSIRETDTPHRIGDLMAATAVNIDRDQLASAKNGYPVQPQNQRASTSEDSKRDRQYETLAAAIYQAASKAGLHERNGEGCGQQNNMAELTKLTALLGQAAKVALYAPDQDAIEAIRQRDMLGKAIGDAAIHAGMCEPDAELTGPQLMMLADDLGAGAAETVKLNLATTPEDNENVEDTWYHRARSEMKEKSITQESLTSVLGVSTRGAVGHYLSGRRDPSPKQLVNLAGVLDVSVGWLMANEEKAPQIQSPNDIDSDDDELSGPSLG